MWTQFMDMHSGGGVKESPYEYIYIEATEAEAKVIFYNRFGHNPERVSCTCCGGDYSIGESESLEQATGYERGCQYAYFNTKGEEVPQDKAWVRGQGMKKGYSSGYVERESEDAWKHHVTLEDYMKNPNVLVIPATHIKAPERVGEVPEEGYVWK